MSKNWEIENMEGYFLRRKLSLAEVELRDCYQSPDYRPPRNVFDWNGICMSSEYQLKLVAEWAKKFPKDQIEVKLIGGTGIVEGGRIWGQGFTFRDLRPVKIAKGKTNEGEVIGSVQTEGENFDYWNLPEYKCIDPMIFGIVGRGLGGNWKNFKEAVIELGGLMKQGGVKKIELNRLGELLARCVNEVNPETSIERVALKAAVGTWMDPLVASGKYYFEKP